MRTRLRFRGEIVPASSVHLGDLVVIEQGQSDLLAIRVTIGHTNYALVLSQLGEDSPRPTPYLVVFDALAADTTPVRRITGELVIEPRSREIQHVLSVRQEMPIPNGGIAALHGGGTGIHVETKDGPVVFDLGSGRVVERPALHAIGHWRLLWVDGEHDIELCAL